MLVYAATQGAIVLCTIALSNLLTPHGIRVNCVASGPIWTPIQLIATDPDETEQLGRAGQPAELAGAFVLLASDAGSYMNGALFPVTGGVSMP